MSSVPGEAGDGYPARRFAMPEPAKPAPQQLPVEVPAWLSESVSPWQVESAAASVSGVRLLLRSDRARIPVRLTRASDGALRMVLLDDRISPHKGGAFVRALEQRLRRAAPLHDWLIRLHALAEQLPADSPEHADPQLAGLIEAWRRWPAREGYPLEQVAELPAIVWECARELPRAAAAALTLYRLARGEVLEALSAWDALPPASAQPSFTELHLDAAALALLGHRQQAIATLARAEAVADGPVAWLTLARAYAALDQREAAVAAHQRVVALRGRDWDRLRLAQARGGFAPGETWPRPNPTASLDERRSFVRKLVKLLAASGRYDDALAAIAELGDQAPSDLLLRAAELHLWRAELTQARACLDALPQTQQDGKAQLIRAATVVLEGRPAEALAMLEQLPDSAPLERLLWQAEAHLALDQIEQALECVDRHIVLENSLPSYLLKLLALVHREPSKTMEDSIFQPTFLDALVIDVLPTLRPAEQIAVARRRADRFAELVRGILDEMGGNRSVRPTWCRRGADGMVRLEPVAVRLSGREAAVANLTRLQTEPPEAVLAGFDTLRHEYPHSPHPDTYRGELLIWLGRYSEAIASFERADQRAWTRWSYVGRAAAYDLLGQAEQADHWTRVGVEFFGELATATTHVYRGERLRKLGAWADARRDLELALAHKTRRIGARINLALSYRALGQHDAWTQQLDRLRADAPAFLWEAGARAGEPLDERTLLTVLELMVGNRSSFLHTMIDRHGHLRVIPDPLRWIGHARLCLVASRDELARAIAARWLG